MKPLRLRLEEARKRLDIPWVEGSQCLRGPAESLRI